MSQFFSFPNPVNERAARIVALGVVILTLLTLITQSSLALAILTAGFVGRVLAGPRLSPLGWIAQRHLAPKLGLPKFVPGPPKRFAQGIGAVLTIAATIFYFTGLTQITWVLLGVLLVASGLEAFVGFCLGCKIFGYLQAWGWVDKDSCTECSNIANPRAATSPAV